MTSLLEGPWHCISVSTGLQAHHLDPRDVDRHDFPASLTGTHDGPSGAPIETMRMLAQRRPAPVPWYAVEVGALVGITPSKSQRLVVWTYEEILLGRPFMVAREGDEVMIEYGENGCAGGEVVGTRCPAILIEWAPRLCIRHELTLDPRVSDRMVTWLLTTH